MAGERRRLRDITTRVSGVVAATVGATPEPTQPPAAPAVDEDGVVTEPTLTAPAPPAPAADVPDSATVADVPDSATVADAAGVAGDAATDAGVDPVCAAAVELARAVALEAGGSAVGEHLGVDSDGPLVVTHSFASTDKAYVGWRWAVTVARAEGSQDVTVDEVVLLPGGGALVAPAWVPWSERVQPGDLSPGDLMPPAPDDLRLVPSYADPEAELAAEVFWELGLARPRLLSIEGRLEAADRWYDGTQGPSGSMARQAPGQCVGCGFLLPMAGGMRALFGVCGNAMAPDDGRVVSLDHGCGAHSETLVEPVVGGGPGMVVEDEELELVPGGGLEPDDETPDGHAS